MGRRSEHFPDGLLLVIAVLTFVVGLTLGGFGIVLVLLGASGSTEFSFFGQAFKSVDVGVAALFISAAMIIIIIRRTLSSFDRTHSSRGVPEKQVTNHGSHEEATSIAKSQPARQNEKHTDEKGSAVLPNPEIALDVLRIVHKLAPSYRNGYVPKAQVNAEFQRSTSQPLCSGEIDNLIKTLIEHKELNSEVNNRISLSPVGRAKLEGERR